MKVLPHLPTSLSNRWVLCSSWEPWWLPTSLCCYSSTCPALTVTATILLCRYNEYGTRNVYVWECQDGIENQYEAAQIKVLVNELLPSQRTRHTVILSPTLHNETSVWRTDHDKCYPSLKPSSPFLTIKTLHSAHIVSVGFVYLLRKTNNYLSGRTVFLWAISKRVVVIPYRRFGPIFKGQESKNKVGHPPRAKGGDLHEAQVHVLWSI